MLSSSIRSSTYLTVVERWR